MIGKPAPFCFRLLLLAESLFVAFTGIWAEETRQGQGEGRNAAPPVEQFLPAFRGRALVCEISASLMDGEGSTVWTAAEKKITLPGRPVSLRLVGDNVVMVFQFTLYFRQDRRDGMRDEDGGAGGGVGGKAGGKARGGENDSAQGSAGEGILVAQGQIWVNLPELGMQYQSTMKTVPIVLNEPVYFFPFGNSDEAGPGGKGDPRLAIQLSLSPYSETAGGL
jgi:hypothetical protein